MSHIVEVTVEEGYEPLLDTLIQALNQAQYGKGKERHAVNDTPFLRQPICEIGRMVGIGSPSGQVIKKTQEANRLPTAQAKTELLGAINYAAATVLLIEEAQNNGG